MRTTQPFTDLADLPTPLAAEAVRVFADAADHLMQTLSLIESVLRFTGGVALARVDDPAARTWAMGQATEALDHPTVGKRLSLLRELDRAAPGCTGWAWDAQVENGAELVQLVEGKKPTSSPSLSRWLDQIPRLRNDYAHGRLNDASKQRERAAAIWLGLVPALRRCALFEATFLVTRTVFAARRRRSMTAWWLRGPVPRPYQEGRRTKAPAKVEAGHVYLVELNGRLRRLDPFIVAVGEHAFVLDSIGGTHAAYHARPGTPADLAPMVEARAIGFEGTHSTAATTEDGPNISLNGGSQLGGFRIVRNLGVGAHSMTYEARSLRDPARATVTLKILKEELADDPWHRALFHSEWEVGRFIDHVNVARVLQSARIEGRFVLVREHVAGASLAAILNALATKQERAPRPEVMVAVAIRILAGLAALHGATDQAGRPLGLPHGALGPARVLISRTGLVKLTDFARTPPGMPREFPSGVIRAQPGYFAPEMTGRFDERADFYCVGVIVWEMLCLRRAFRSVVTGGSLGRPSCWAPGVASALDAVVLRSLQRDPNRRYHSAAAFVHALIEACPSAARVAPGTIGAMVEGAAV